MRRIGAALGWRSCDVEGSETCVGAVWAAVAKPDAEAEGAEPRPARSDSAMAATRKTGAAEPDLSAHLLASVSCQPIILARLFDSGKEYPRLTLLGIGVCACRLKTSGGREFVAPRPSDEPLFLLGHRMPLCRGS